MKMFDAGKTRIIGLRYSEKNYDSMLSHLIQERHGRTDGRTDRIAISISRVSVLTPVTIFNMAAVRHLEFKKILICSRDCHRFANLLLCTKFY